MKASTGGRPSEFRGSVRGVIFVLFHCLKRRSRRALKPDPAGEVFEGVYTGVRDWKLGTNAADGVSRDLQAPTTINRGIDGLPYPDRFATAYCGSSDYYGVHYNSTIPQYWFVNTLSDILMGLLQAGLCLEHFTEYPTDISAGHKRVEQAQAGVPLSYTLIARKQPGG